VPHISVMLTTNANGEQAPPFFIFSGDVSDVPLVLAEEYQDSCWLHAEESGFMTNTAFSLWLMNFLDFIDERRQKEGNPRQIHLLLLDGHKSRIQPVLMQVALERGVYILCSPAHTTHLVQPNDQAFNRSLHHLVDNYIASLLEASAEPTPESFAVALMEALQHQSMPSVIKKSWATAGIWPKDEKKRQAQLVKEHNILHMEKAVELEIAMAVTA
jgi:hypothetical protein